MKKVLVLMMMVVLNVPLFQTPFASAIDLTAKCVKLSLKSSTPLLRPMKDSDIAYSILYSNLCSTEIPSVEIALGVRSTSYPYDWRPITTGGKLGKLTGNQKGEVALRLSYYSFSEVSETIYLYVKEDYPLTNTTSIASTNVNFSNSTGPSTVSSPSTTASPTPKSESSQDSFSIKPQQTSSTPSSISTQSVKVGAACKKSGVTSLSANKSVICKKNTRGKLVWTLTNLEVRVSLTTGFVITRGTLGEPTTSEFQELSCKSGVVVTLGVDGPITGNKKSPGTQLRLESDGQIIALGTLDTFEIDKDIIDLPNKKYPNNKLQGALCILRGVLNNVPQKNFYTLFVDGIRIYDYSLVDVKKGISLQSWYK